MPALPRWYTGRVDIVNSIYFQCPLAKKVAISVRKETALLQQPGSLKVLEDDKLVGL